MPEEATGAANDRGGSKRGGDGYALLAHPHRRRVLSSLAEAEGAASLATLARAVAADEADADAETVGSDAIQRAYLALFHVHVPKLADAGVVRFDEDSNAVSPGDRFDEVASLLAEADG